MNLQTAQDLHDRRFMHVSSRSELFLKCSELPRELGRGAKCFAHFCEARTTKILI